MVHRLKTPEGKQLYALRKQVAEPVFGIIKSVLGFRQFLLRGLDQVRGEWGLVTMAWNLKQYSLFAPQREGAKGFTSNSWMHGLVAGHLSLISRCGQCSLVPRAIADPAGAATPRSQAFWRPQPDRLLGAHPDQPGASFSFREATAAAAVSLGWDWWVCRPASVRRRT